MTKVTSILGAELGATESKPRAATCFLPAISADSVITQTQGYLVQEAGIMTYRDVVNKSGMSWSNMLKETALVEFKHLNSQSRKRPIYCQRHSMDRQSYSNPNAPYHWIRTENLEHEQLATDRPYRNTYGDGKSQPSKLHLSTELPELAENPLSVEGVGQSQQPASKDKWKPNRNIAKIYNLLHDGDVKHLNRLHVFTRRRPGDKNLPTVLPHFHIKLTQSINQVLKDAEIQPDVLFSRRPMTSEKVTYFPITEKSANPELTILKTGKVEYREKKESARRTIPKPQKTPPIATPPREQTEMLPNWDGEPSLTTKKLPKMERESAKGRVITKGFSITPRLPASKPTIGVSDLQAAEGFPLSVKITPKVHPANDKQKLNVQ